MIDVISAIFGVIIMLFLARWIFRIDTIISYQKKQYELTKLMAMKQGIEAKEIEATNYAFNETPHIRKAKKVDGNFTGDRLDY